MLFYILEDQKERYAIVSGDKEIIPISINLYLRKLATSNLTNIKEYKKCISKVLKIERLTPIYLNKNQMLFKVKPYIGANFVYINYMSLLGVCYNGEDVMFVFVNSDTLVLSASKFAIQGQLEKCKKIVSYYDLINAN